MTKKDYIIIAKVLQNFSNKISKNVFNDLLEEFEVEFIKDNSRFNSGKFKQAVGN